MAGFGYFGKLGRKFGLAFGHQGDVGFAEAVFELNDAIEVAGFDHDALVVYFSAKVFAYFLLVFVYDEGFELMFGGGARAEQVGLFDEGGPVFEVAYLVDLVDALYEIVFEVALFFEFDGVELIEGAGNEGVFRGLIRVEAQDKYGDEAKGEIEAE